MPSDKTPLEDSRLDLNADHVHPYEMTADEANGLLQGDAFSSAFEEILNDAVGYTDLENKDAVVVITIKTAVPQD